VQPAPHRLPFQAISRWLVWTLVFWMYLEVFAYAQLPRMASGPDAGFAQLEFTQMYLDQMSQPTKEGERQKARNQALIDSGIVSVFDLEAPKKAVEEFNRANSFLRAQNTKEGIKHLQKAIGVYPSFVSAHVGLGLAYVDQEDTNHARSEFETAAKLDGKFPASFLNLGVVAMSLNDFAAAQLALEKAASLRPADARILTALAYAQNGTHQYLQALQTAQRVHALDHQGMANVGSVLI
jgi:tetratricopeptide (TPR) repeat protein